jgi:hypothetical protein
MYTSSTPRSSISGAMSWMVFLNRREKRRTSSKSTGSMIACGHSLAAFIRPMAEPTPKVRAA